MPQSNPAHILIIEARFYDDICDRLLDGALQVLDGAGASYERITVPGALEVPGAVRMALQVREGEASSKFDGFLPLGCVIRGETSHYDHVAEECIRGTGELVTRFGLAVGMGVLTVEDRAQAESRSDPAGGDKGGVAARACLRMIAVKRGLAGNGE